jgi:DNA gyrase/topoisomerase IV subunit A
MARKQKVDEIAEAHVANTHAQQEAAAIAYMNMMVYGINVNLERANVSIDGFKPVGRKTVFSIFNEYRDRKFTVKSAKGSVGKIHPHGDSSVEDAFINMAQDFKNNIPLLTAEANVGNPESGKDAASARYLDMRLSKFALDTIFDEFDGKVNMVPNYDNTMMEPYLLPVKFPLILLNASSGIGYTLSSDIPPYNLCEIIDATIKLIKNPDAKIMLVPDSPTGCDIIIRDENKFTMQSTFEVDNVNYIITFKSTPYMKFIDDIDAKLRLLQDSPYKIPEILSVDTLRVGWGNRWEYVVRCSPCNLYGVVNKLFQKIGGFRDTLSTRNMHVVIDFQIKKYNVRQILCAWIKHRTLEKHNFITRKLVKTNKDLNRLEGKAHMLSPENLNKTIKIVRECPEESEIIPALMKAYPGQTSAQANTVAQFRIGKLTHGEYKRTIERIQEVTKELEELRLIMSESGSIERIIIDELKTIKAKYGTPRRSRILNSSTGETVNIEVVQILKDGTIIFGETENPEHLSSDVTPISGDKICLIDVDGDFLWVDVNKMDHGKPLSLTSIGRSFMGPCIFASSSEQNLICVLTNKGRIKTMPVNRIPSNSTRRPILPMGNDEEIVAAIELRDTNTDILVYTKDGLGKRIQAEDLSIQQSIDATGHFIIKNCDNVAGMFTLHPEKPLLTYVTKLGRIRVNNAKYLNAGKKYAVPTHIIKLSAQDDLVAVFCSKPGKTIALNHADGQVSTVNIDSLGVVTMATDPKRPKHVPGIPVIRATIG